MKASGVQQYSSTIEHSPTNVVDLSSKEGNMTILNEHPFTNLISTGSGTSQASANQTQSRGQKKSDKVVRDSNHRRGA